jgi:hypothetical protein
MKVAKLLKVREVAVLQGDSYRLLPTKFSGIAHERCRGHDMSWILGGN